jgi:carbonic anhydrase
MRDGPCRLVAWWMAAALALAAGPAWADGGGDKPGAEQALRMLREGNARFAAGRALGPHRDADRLRRAGAESQADHAFATVLACSDSRVPVEIIFDAGVMDIFVVRVAGNVVRTDEAGSIEYGLAHVRTPVLVVLGHSQCGAVTAVTDQALGRGHELERNIPPLVAPIVPAVERAMAAHPELAGRAVIPAAIRENVWQAIRDLFRMSPATRRLVRQGRAEVVGAVYDVATGEVAWLPRRRTARILAEVEAGPPGDAGSAASTD